MAWRDEFVAEHELPEGYAGSVRPYVRKVAERILRAHRESDRAIIVGISGAQGSGKTTFARFLSKWLGQRMRLSAVCLSLDDVYLTRAERRELAHRAHPLLETRGVPGTHDVPLAHRTLDALTHPGIVRKVAVPAFDKATDDRAPEQNWRRVDAPADVLVFEGWCVGAQPQTPDSLSDPVNELEAAEDLDASWRTGVNQRLRTDYAELFARLDLLVMLRVPSFNSVFEWRALQERKLSERLHDAPAGSEGPPGLSPAELKRFIQHYERLTRHILETMPDYADAVIDIDANHRMTGITRPGARASRPHPGGEGVPPSWRARRRGGMPPLRD